VERAIWGCQKFRRNEARLGPSLGGLGAKGTWYSDGLSFADLDHVRPWRWRRGATRHGGDLTRQRHAMQVGRFLETHYNLLHQSRDLLPSMVSAERSWRSRECPSVRLQTTTRAEQHDTVASVIHRASMGQAIPSDVHKRSLLVKYHLAAKIPPVGIHTAYLSSHALDRLNTSSPRTPHKHSALPVNRRNCSPPCSYNGPRFEEVRLDPSHHHHRLCCLVGLERCQRCRQLICHVRGCENVEDVAGWYSGLFH
jgi:hypothetical protein